MDTAGRGTAHEHALANRVVNEILSSADCLGETGRDRCESCRCHTSIREPAPRSPPARSRATVVAEEVLVSRAQAARHPAPEILCDEALVHLVGAEYVAISVTMIENAAGEARKGTFASKRAPQEKTYPPVDAGRGPPTGLADAPSARSSTTLDGVDSNPH